MSASLPGQILFRAFTQGAAFAPLAGGWLTFYKAGTTTPQAVYADAAQTTPYANPLQLDANGQATFFLGAGLSYKINLQDVALVDQAGWPVDNISAAQGLSGISAVTGTPNALVMTVPAASVYSSGLYAAFTPTDSNSGAMTINAGAGAVPLTRNDGVALGSGDLIAGATYTALYNTITASFNIMQSVPSQIQATINATSTWPTSSTITGGTNPPVSEFVITPTPAIAAYTGAIYYVKFQSNGITGYNTLAISGLTAIPIKQYNNTGALVPAQVISGQVGLIQYLAVSNCFLLVNALPPPVHAGGRFKNLVVTYPQSSATVTITADEATVEDVNGGWTTLKNVNVSASLGTPGAINGTDGSALAMTTAANVTASCATNVLTISAVNSGIPAIGMTVSGAGYPAGTTITSWGTFNGTSGTANLSTSPGTVGSGSVNLQGGNNYAVFITFNPATGVVGALISSSATAQNQPGTVMTDPSTGTSYSQSLLVSWNSITNTATPYWYPGIQRGNEFSYTVGSYLTSLRHLVDGASGSISTPTWTAIKARGNGYAAPSAATSINVMIHCYNNNLASVMAAPNNAYGAISSGSNPPPLIAVSATVVTGHNVSGKFMFESDNIYYAANDASCGLFCTGWTLNL